jgi:hypothetical protein
MVHRFELLFKIQVVNYLGQNKLPIISIFIRAKDHIEMKWDKHVDLCKSLNHQDIRIENPKECLGLIRMR